MELWNCGIDGSCVYAAGVGMHEDFYLGCEIVK